MDTAGLVSKIVDAVFSIDAGRKGFATRGKEAEGRILYEDGIALAMSVFKEAQTTANPLMLLLAESAYVTQEKQLCDKSDKDTINSLSKAIESFDDAFLALKAVENPHYTLSDDMFPHNKNFRFKGYPKDAYHIAFIAHKTRLQNILRTPGLDPIEKALLKQRIDNIPAAQDGYVEKQKKAFAN